MAEPKHEVTLEILFEIVVEMSRQLQRYQGALLDPNGALQRMDRQIRELRDHVTNALLLAGAVARPPKPESTNDFTVLIVDDEPSLVATFSRILKSYGFHVEGARNGADAIALLNSVIVDVVLCDLNMPGNGSTLAKHVVAKHPETSIVIMSGLEEGTVARETLNVGALHYLLKPFPPAESVVLTIRSAGLLARARRARMLTIPPPPALPKEIL